MRRVQFSMVYPDGFVHPLHRRVVEEESLSRAELLTWSPTPDATALLWCDGDRAATERAVEPVGSRLESAFVAESDGTYVFLRQAEYELSVAVLETVADAGVAFLPPVVFLETGAVRFEAVGETTALGAFHEALSELGDLGVERVEEFDRQRSLSLLTGRQRAALEAAVAAGYYEVPREGSVADVAARLDCSSSTAGELLRKAEAAVLTDHVER
jgi:predicted DNA binding protein